MNNKSIQYKTYSLKMVKGYKINIPFTIFILCDKNKIEEQCSDSNTNLTKPIIVYKMIGHNVSEEIIDNVIKFINAKYISIS